MDIIKDYCLVVYMFTENKHLIIAQGNTLQNIHIKLKIEEHEPH